MKYILCEIFYSLKEAQILTERWREDRTRRWATGRRHRKLSC
jgi:hypothetical protein